MLSSLLSAILDLYTDCDEELWGKDELPDKKEIDERDINTPDDWISRDSSMIRVTGNHPFNAEPPVDVLMNEFFTPVKNHYVRNHREVPKIKWNEHRICMSVDNTLVHRLSMGELVSMRAVSIPVTMTCAGNRRKEQNQVRKSKGFDWGSNALATSVWTGVYLLDVLERYRMIPTMDKPYYVIFEGKGNLPKGKYGTSVPIEKLIDPTREAILAYKQDGEWLDPDHGYPVRMIIPGFIGGRMVKWLDTIKISSTESDSYYHFHDNRVLPSNLNEFILESKPQLWRSPEYVIYDRNINSVITSPGHKEVLVGGKGHHKMKFKGYAYCGGGNKLIRVEISTDGIRWLQAKIERNEKPRHGKYWCWIHWSLDIDVKRIIGSQGIYVRAWDDMMNTQNREIIWNVLGMMNNSWYKVVPEIDWIGEGIAVKFVHPVSVSGEYDGWMRDSKPVKQVRSASQLSTSLPIVKTEELQRHNSEDSCWIQIGDNNEDNIFITDDYR